MTRYLAGYVVSLLVSYYMVSYYMVGYYMVGYYMVGYYMVGYYMVGYYMVSYVVTCMISRLTSEPPDRISSGEPEGHIAGEDVGRDGFK